MQCPACDQILTSRVAGDVTVDVCEGGCGGIWFDNFELKKLDEAHETAANSLLDIERDPDIVVDRQQRRSCPVCEEMPLMRHFWSAAHEVEIDECPACGGIWLDAGELDAIRSLFATEADQRAATEAVLDDLFGEELASVDDDADFEDDVPALPRRLGRIFSFLGGHRPAA